MDRRIYYHADALLHEQDAGHPERPDRVRTLVDALTSHDPDSPVVASEPAEIDDVLRVHRRDYVEAVRESAETERTVFDPDTVANRHTLRAALLAAGGALEATRAVLAGERVAPFVAMRPPGHHAMPDRAMGFCVFNNVAIAAEDAIVSGVERVAIVDWDVHHGNGTEFSFRERRDIFYASIHQFPHYPGTGRATDVGSGRGRGTTVNVPLPAGCGEAEYLRAVDEVIVPALERFRPQLVLVSAGFDAHERDPLAGMLLTGTAYYRITERLLALAQSVCDGRIVHLLEGGYDLNGLADGAQHVLDALAGRSPSADDAGADDA